MEVLKILIGGIFSVVASFFISILLFVWYTNLKRKIKIYLTARRLSKSKDPKIKELGNSIMNYIKKQKNE